MRHEKPVFSGWDEQVYYKLPTLEFFCIISTPLSPGYTFLALEKWNILFACTMTTTVYGGKCVLHMGQGGKVKPEDWDLFLPLLPVFVF